MMITKGIVDLHAGDIRVYSEGTGMGCTFTLILPLSKPPSAAPAVMATHRSSTRLFGSSTYSDPVPPPRPPSPASVLFDEESAFSSAEVNTATASSDLDSCGPTVNFYQRTAAYRRTLDALPLDNGVKIGQGSSAVTRRLQVLVVDDSALNRKMLVRLLKAENICCDEADDGVVAVKMTAERYRLSLENPVRTVDCETGVGEGKDDGQTLMYDAILMDFMMPNMDGPTATREIRAMGYEGVILGVTGNALPSDIDHFVRKGANRVLTKPVDIRELKSALGCIGGLLH